MAKHWRSFLESNTLGVGDLPDPTSDLTVRITKVEAGKVAYSNGPTKRALISFQGFKKAYSSGATFMGSCAAFYGADPANWIGKPIAIYATMVNGYGGGKVDGIRVRETKPRADAKCYGDTDAGPAPFDLDGTLSEIAGCGSREDVEALAASIKAIVPTANRATVKAALDAKRATFPPLEATP